MIYDVLSSYRLYNVQFKEVKFLWGRGPDNPNTVLNVLNNKVKNSLFTDVKMNFFFIECFF